MIEKIISFIKSMKRPETIVDNYGNHYIYNDKDQCYEEIAINKARFHEVCNIEGFAKAVCFNFAKQIGKQVDPIVIFNEQGARLFTNDILGDNQDVWVFRRAYTSLWDTVIMLSRAGELNHRDLLNKLESVKNYIVDFEQLYLKLSKLRASKKISFASNPIFTDGETSGAYEWEQKIDSDHTEKASCPSRINFKGKIVRGSEAVYEFAVNLVPIIDEGNGKLLFKVFMPTIELVLDQVREDEYADFLRLIGDDVAKATLIVRNY